jgi:hypothetical protein
MVVLFIPCLSDLSHAFEKQLKILSEKLHTSGEMIEEKKKTRLAAKDLRKSRLSHPIHSWLVIYY